MQQDSTLRGRGLKVETSCSSPQTPQAKLLEYIQRTGSVSSIESSSSSSKRHQLRSTKHGQKINYSERTDAGSTESTKGARTSHNLVEKQYRTRLNSHFSTLLGVLPQDVVGAEIDGYGGGDTSGPERKVSKAEVLVLAKSHIETLEQTKQRLEGDKEALLEDVQRLKGAWVRMGG